MSNTRVAVELCVLAILLSLGFNPVSAARIGMIQESELTTQFETQLEGNGPCSTKDYQSGMFSFNSCIKSSRCEWCSLVHKKVMGVDLSSVQSVKCFGKQPEGCSEATPWRERSDECSQFYGGFCYSTDCARSGAEGNCMEEWNCKRDGATCVSYGDKGNNTSAIPAMQSIMARVEYEQEIKDSKRNAELQVQFDSELALRKQQASEGDERLPTQSCGGFGSKFGMPLCRPPRCGQSDMLGNDWPQRLTHACPASGWPWNWEADDGTWIAPGGNAATRLPSCCMPTCSSKRQESCYCNTEDHVFFKLLPKFAAIVTMMRAKEAVKVCRKGSPEQNAVNFLASFSSPGFLRGLGSFGGTADSYFASLGFLIPEFREYSCEVATRIFRASEIYEATCPSGCWSPGTALDSCNAQGLDGVRASEATLRSLLVDQVDCGDEATPYGEPICKTAA